MEPHDQCQDCVPAQSSVSFRCYDCNATQHVHDERWAEATAGAMVLLSCPQCEARNAIKKRTRPYVVGAKVVDITVQLQLPLGVTA